MERCCISARLVGPPRCSARCATASPASAASTLASQRRVPAALKAPTPPRRAHRRSLMCHGVLGDGPPAARVPKDLSTDTRYFEEDAADDHDGILGFSANDVRSTSTTIEAPEEDQEKLLVEHHLVRGKDLAREEDPDNYHVMDFWETVVSIKKGPNDEYDFSEVYVATKDEERRIIQGVRGIENLRFWSHEALEFSPVQQTDSVTTAKADTYCAVPWITINTVLKDNGSPEFRKLMNQGVDPDHPQFKEMLRLQKVQKQLEKLKPEIRKHVEETIAEELKEKSARGDFRDVYADQFDFTEERVFKIFLIREHPCDPLDNPWRYETWLDYRQVFCVHFDGTVTQEEVQNLHLLDDPDVGEPQLIIRPDGLTIQDIRTTPTVDELIDAWDRKQYEKNTTMTDWSMPPELQRYADSKPRPRPEDINEQDTWYF